MSHQRQAENNLRGAFIPVQEGWSKGERREMEKGDKLG